jgi:hypothetical protein
MDHPGRVTHEGKQLAPTFPIFVCGQDINVAAESDYRVSLAFQLDGDIRVDARVFLSVPKSSSSRADRIRELERLREELLAGG